MNEKLKAPFDLSRFLATAGLGRRLVEIKAKDSLFRQGEAADGVYYLQKGRAKLSVISAIGKEATITLIVPGDFIGEEALRPAESQRITSAESITPCSALFIERREMMRVIHDESAFTELFLAFLLARSLQSQNELINQLFHCSEQRLARVLLMMVYIDARGEPESLIPAVTQDALAEMVGTTRSRVSFFMNRFRALGYIDYNRRIRVYPSLRSVIDSD